MARKSRAGRTTSPRYVLKMYRNTGASTQTPQYAEMAKDAATSMEAQRSDGTGVFKVARQEAREVLLQSNVSSLLWGAYYAFVNEYVNKVQQRHSASRDDLTTKYSSNGLDSGVLSDLADAISGQSTTTTQKPSKTKS